MTRAKIHILLVSEDDAIFECDEFAIREGTFTAVMRKDKDGEPEHLKIFPLCNILELDINNTK